jgi:hypothetical protein
MTKKLEELLNLPESQEIIDEDSKPKKRGPKPKKRPEELNDTLRSIADMDKITQALPKVQGLGDAADVELDEVAQRSIEAYDDLMDLGMNVESRYSSRIFEVAGQMLKTNLDAKVAKLDKKIKMVELQLKKEKLDNDKAPVEQTIVETEGFVITDRNSLLEKLKNIDK